MLTVDSPRQLALGHDQREEETVPHVERVVETYFPMHGPPPVEGICRVRPSDRIRIPGER